MKTKLRLDPYRHFNFIVELDGVQLGGFSEASGLESEVTVVDYREGAEKTRVTRKLPGLHKVPSITLQRGVANRKIIFEWRASGSASRRPATVILRDEARQPARRWQIANASINKIIGPTLNATGNDVAIETLELAHEGLTLAD